MTASTMGGNAVTVNVFEGARRIAVVLGAAWVGGCIWYAAVTDPFVAGMAFSISKPGEAPKRVNACEADDASSYLAPTKEAPVHVTLCFPAERAADGRMLIPYPSKGVSVRMPDGTLIENVPDGLTKAELLARLKAGGYDVDKLLNGQASKEPFPVPSASAPARFEVYALGERYSTNVSQYVTSVANSFVFPADALEEATRRRQDARSAQLKSVGMVMVVVLAAGWVCLATVGWIVRGFFGIARGKDTRASD